MLFQHSLSERLQVVDINVLKKWLVIRKGHRSVEHGVYGALSTELSNSVQEYHAVSMQTR